jgi:hypothetical protein
MRADASAYKDEAEIHGKPRPLPGIYHVVVKTTDDSRTKVKTASGVAGTKVELEVLAGTVPGQEGREIEHVFWLDENGNETEKHVRFCMALGLIQPGTTRDFDFDSEAPGRQCVVRLEEVEGKGKSAGKKFLQIGNFGLDVWSVNHPEVATVPKNAQALALIGGAGQRQPSGVQPQPQAKPVQQQQQAQPQASGGGWDNV